MSLTCHCLGKVGRSYILLFGRSQIVGHHHSTSTEYSFELRPKIVSSETKILVFGITVVFRFLARDSMLSALYAIANPSVCLSVRLSVTRVDQSKTVEARIMQFHHTVAPSL